MEVHPPLFGDCAYLPYRLDRAYLVVGVHDGDKDSVVGYRRLHVSRVNHAIPVHGKIGHPETALLQEMQRLQYGMVLNGAGDDVLALLFQGEGHAFDSQVVCLGPPAGEDDFLRPRVDESCDTLPCSLHGHLGILPEIVNAGRVPIRFGEIGQHRLQHIGMDRCGGSVIKIYPFHCGLPSIYYNVSWPVMVFRSPLPRR